MDTHKPESASLKGNSSKPPMSRSPLNGSPILPPPPGKRRSVKAAMVRAGERMAELQREIAALRGDETDVFIRNLHGAAKERWPTAREQWEAHYQPVPLADGEQTPTEGWGWYLGFRWSHYFTGASSDKFVTSLCGKQVPLFWVDALETSVLESEACKQCAAALSQRTAVNSP